MEALLRTESERRLWQSVLIHGLKESLGGRDQHWLFSPDFSEVCRLAGFEPALVSDAIDARNPKALMRELQYLGGYPDAARSSVKRTS